MRARGDSPGVGSLVEEAEVIRGQVQGDRARLTGREKELFEAFEFERRPVDPGRFPAAGESAKSHSMVKGSFPEGVVWPKIISAAAFTASKNDV